MSGKYTGKLTTEEMPKVGWVKLGQTKQEIKHSAKKPKALGNCINCTNKARLPRSVVGTHFPARVKRVNFWNEDCPLSPALAVIWCDWMEFSGKGNIWEPNRDGVKLMFLNHWVSGSEASLDVRSANNPVFLGAPEESLLIAAVKQNMIGSATRTHTQTHTDTHTCTGTRCWHRSKPLRDLHTTSTDPPIQRAGT